MGHLALLVIKTALKVLKFEEKLPIVCILKSDPYICIVFVFICLGF